MNALAGFFYNIIGFINYVLVPFVFALAFFAFLWGVFTYFIAGGASEDRREKGRSFILSGIIGFVVMLSLWGIVNLLMNSLGFRSQARPSLPTFGGSSNMGGYGGFGGSGGATLPANSCGFLGYCDGFGSEKCVGGQCVSGGSAPSN